MNLVNGVCETPSPADSLAPLTRRCFGKSLLVGGSMALSSAAGLNAQGSAPRPGGPRLAADHLSINSLTDDYLKYLKAMGVEVMDVGGAGVGGLEGSSYEALVKIKRRVEDAGFKLGEVMGNVGNMRQTSVGLPGRDAEIKAFQQFIRDLGKAGIGYTTYTWNTMGPGYQTGTTTTRGCQTRLFELSEVKKVPNLHDREHSEEEVWANYEYFIKRVLPVAEDAGVHLQAHPNDPPVTYGGVARIFRSRQAFRRAMEISNHSPYSGLLFCMGCWGEMFGPDGKGEDIVGAIREFGSRHIFDVHFRNLSSNLPNFSEVFPDNGYLNMYRIMRALVEINYSGPVVPDHVPTCSTEKPAVGTYHEVAPESFAFGYIRAMIQAAETELGRRA